MRIAIVLAALALLASGCGRRDAPPTAAELARRGLLNVSALPPVAAWSASPIDTSANHEPCTLAPGGTGGGAADARRGYSGGGVEILEAVEITPGAPAIDGVWRRRDPGRLLR